MEKHRCKVKFDGRKIVCASEILCSDCPESNKCQDIDIFIEEKFENVKGCMSANSHKRKNGRLHQTRHAESR